MKNRFTLDDLYFVATLVTLTLALAYVLQCAYDMCVILSNLDNLGLAMLPIAPTFSVSSHIRSDRRFSETDRMRNYAGLHTPAYRVLNHVSKALLDAGLYGVCTVMNSRSQFKSISYKSLFSVTIDHGYSSVSIGARQVFGVDEWTRTIYHIDASGTMHTTPYHQGYDMTDVIAQVSEAIEVLADFYTADKLKALEEQRQSTDWMCYAAENVGVVRDWERATVKCWFVKWSNKSVEWTKFWGRMTPSGSKEYKTTTGSHRSAYQVVIGSTTYWLPHSILSREWELHGGRTFKSDHSVDYFQFSGVIDTIDLPVWWLEKTIGVDWADKVEPIGRSEFFKTYVNKPRRRRNR